MDAEELEKFENTFNFFVHLGLERNEAFQKAEAEIKNARAEKEAVRAHEEKMKSMDLEKNNLWKLFYLLLYTVIFTVMFAT